MSPLDVILFFGPLRQSPLTKLLFSMLLLDTKLIFTMLPSPTVIFKITNGHDLSRG